MSAGLDILCVVRGPGRLLPEFTCAAGATSISRSGLAAGFRPVEPIRNDAGDEYLPGLSSSGRAGRRLVVGPATPGLRPIPLGPQIRRTHATRQEHSSRRPRRRQRCRRRGHALSDTQEAGPAVLGIVAAATAVAAAVPASASASTQASPAAGHVY